MKPQRVSDERAHDDRDASVFAIVALAAGVGVALAVVWLVPLAIAWVDTGHTGRLTIVQAEHAVMGSRLLGDHPALAYPASLRWRLPTGGGYWVLFGIVSALPLVALTAVAHRARIAMSLPAADRRWWSLRGRRPAEFARWGTVRPLIVPCASAGRHVVGLFGHPGALLACERGAHIALIAPTGAGKTTAEMIPIILEHPGPTVSSTTKTDVIRATIQRRRQLGEVMVWDPFGVSQDGDGWVADCWDPLLGCEFWAHALQVARWLDRARLGGGEGVGGETATEKFFGVQSMELTAPLLHAAALGRARTIVDVLTWVRNREVAEPKEILEAEGTPEALEAVGRLESVFLLEPRQRDSIIGTAQVQLSAYGHPAAAASAQRAGRISTPELVEAANTLYIVADREQQALLAPLVVMLLSSIQHHVSRLERQTGSALSPPLLIALDETANIAPIKDLPEDLSVGRSAGKQYVTSWQSVAQIYRHYGRYGGREILANTACKVFLGAIEDEETRSFIADALGRHQVVDGELALHTPRDVATAQALRTVRPDRGLLLHKGYPAVWFRQRAWYRNHRLRRLAAGKDPSRRPALTSPCRIMRPALGPAAAPVRRAPARPLRGSASRDLPIPTERTQW